MAQNIDLYIDQGSDFSAVLPPVTDLNGNIVDLTGFTITSDIRRSYATVFAVQLSTGFGIDSSTGLPDPTLGIITLSLTNQETAGLVPVRWVYDVVTTDVMGIITKVFEGLMTVNPGVSSQPNTTLLTPFVPDDWGGL